MNKSKHYRYPHYQKTKIEKQAAEMMIQGIIQESNSSFSAPVLLVKKSDGTWRFCVDYRKLNDATIEHKFPIPLIEELLDELKDVVFNKLDFKAGYHQVRMHPEDEFRTAFPAHSG